MGCRGGGVRADVLPAGGAGSVDAGEDRPGLGAAGAVERGTVAVAAPWIHRGLRPARCADGDSGREGGLMDPFTLQPDKPGPLLRRLSDVVPQPVEWLWPQRFAVGKLSLIFGDPGKGKSFITLDMAARVSTGANWPDGSG